MLLGQSGAGHQILVAPVHFSTGNNDVIYSELLVLNDTWDTLQYRRFNRRYISNFARWNLHGDIRYTYYLQDTNAYKPHGVEYTSGNIYITDAQLNVLKKIKLLPHDHIKAQKQQTVDGHDFIYISDTHYIVLAYHEQEAHNIPGNLHPAKNVHVLSSIIQEVRNDSVIWQWDGAEHPELYEASYLDNNFSDTAKTQDYLHVNSLFINSDTTLLVSCKNSNQVLNVDRRTGTILWRLGGKHSDFPMADSQYFIHQHHVTITADGHLLMFDNGDKNLRPQSRILEFGLNVQHKKIRTFRSITLPGKFTPSAGSAQKIGDYYFVNTGTMGDIMQLNYKTGKVISEKHLPNATYRAMRY